MSSERAAVLEATVGDLEDQLTEQEQEASDVISQWETRFTELQTANAELTQSLEETFNRRKELADENDSLASSQAQLIETEAALTDEMKKALSWKGRICVSHRWDCHCFPTEFLSQMGSHFLNK